eukprot:SAG25_NODE_188_length_12354_cov_23.716116_4_plen_1319_part_00
MASGQIKRSEISEKDLYKDIRDSAKKTITMLDKMNVQLKKTGTTLKTELNGTLQKTTAGIQKMQQAVAKADSTMKKSVQLDKDKANATKAKIQAERELEKLAQDKQRTQQAVLKTQQAQSREDQRQITNAKKKAKAVKDESNAYTQLVKKTRDQKNESKRLGAEMLKLEQAGKRNTREYKKLSQSFNSVTASAKRGDRQLKKLDKRVGDNFRNVGNYRSALGKLSGAFASLGLAMGGAMIIRNVFGVIKDFDQAQANLASVLGINRIEMQGLTDDAKRLGATTVFTASQVSELQLSFAKLGLTQKEIRNVTGATLDLASATGTDLAESATVVGSTIRAFGLDTIETQRVVDVMANSFSKSSLDMSKFATAMANVAPVAKNAGRNVEQTTALLATLTDRGVDASTAGTGLRNVFLQLTKEGITFEQAMRMIQDSSDKNATSLELFGKRGAVVGTILAENTDITAKLTEELNNSAGASAKMAQMQIDTLGGSLKLLQSAWEGWILKTNEAGGVGEDIKEIIQSLAENLEWILDTIVTVGKAWLTYKAITMLQIGANRVLASSFMKGVRGMGMFKGAINGIKTAVMGLANVIKNNLIGLALFALMDAVMQFQKIQGIMDKTKDNQLEIANAMNKVSKSGKEEESQVEALFGALKKTNPESEERYNLMNKINREYNLSLKNLKDEVSWQKQLAEAQKEVIKQIRLKTEAEGARVRYEMAVRQQATSEENIKKLERTLADFRAQNVGTRFLKNYLFDHFGVESENDIIEELTAWRNVEVDDSFRLKDAKKAWEKLQVDIAGVSSSTPQPTPSGSASAGGYVSLLREIEDEVIKQMEDAESRETEKAIVDAQRRKKDLNKIKASGKQKRKLRTEIDESLEIDLAKIRQKYAKKEIQEQVKRNNQWVATKKAQRDLALNDLEDNTENFKAREKIFVRFEKQEKKALERKMNWELRNKELSETEKKKIVAEYYLAVDKLDRMSIERITTNQERLLADMTKRYSLAEKQKKLQLLRSNKDQEKIDAKMLDFQIKQLEKEIKERKDLGVSTIDQEIKLEELRRQKTEVAKKKTIDDAKTLANEQLAIVQSVTDATIALIDRRIEKIDEEIEKHEEKYSRLAEMAKNGNINAQQSLAVEAKLIAEANRKKEKMERQKQRVQLAGDALQAYMRNSEDPDVKNPLLKTFTDITLLTQFIQQLPFFEDGTEDTGKSGRGIDGKGGFLSVLHPNERVLTKDQNAKIGDMSNEDLAQMALRSKTNSFMDQSILKQNINHDTKQVVEALTSLEQTIKNKPETNIEFERIIDGAMQVVRKTKEGNTVTFNRYRTQK